MARRNANQSLRKRVAKNLIQIWRRKKDDQPDPAGERRSWDKETDTTQVAPEGEDKKKSDCG